MKLTNLLLVITFCFSMFSCGKMASEKAKIAEKTLTPQREFYQLKTYLLDTEAQVRTTDKYLKEAYLPALKKLNIKNIGVFKPRPKEGDTSKSILVLIPFSSMDQFLLLDSKLAKNKAYLAAGSEYLNASYKQPPYQRIESVLMKAFKDMPIMQASKLTGPRSNRVYELRSYESATEAIYNNKVDMFNAGGEVTLFEDLGFNAVFYADVISGAKMPNLMYMTTFADQKNRDEHWDAFRASPVWTKLKNMEKYKNNVSHADIFFLYPTEYSDY